ncbi:MAG: cytochrome c oxidase subunit I [Chloroflexi bacterium]|nr:cytochrome c oxidase subunit I [Chloroflexota bacterium]MCL5110440.1 cytochrome c oxidase subunit I [Chloroflexota bacterium]
MSSRSEAAPAEPWGSEGLLSWLTTTDHKRIGILYIVTSFAFFLVGVTEASLMRWQLAQPQNAVLGPEQYNQMFTMHGTTMIFLFLMPMLTGLGNYVVPLMLGARDMAFPRLNGFGYWLFLLSGLFLYSSFLFSAAPDGGWFAYVPMTDRAYSPGRNIDFWVLGVQLLGVSSIAASVNFVVTILRLRAPGMTMNRMPMFAWTVLVTAFLILFAFPSLTAAASLLMLDRFLGTLFYSAPAGGDPLLWQHLFWAFGHPEVYILILPAMGIISEIVPVFSGKPLFGYIFVAWSSVAIAFLGFIVWAHHMFATGLPAAVQAFFALTSMIIAVPTAVKIFNWIATMWGGRIRLQPPMMFAIGFIALFIFGGMTGISVAVVPFDWQVTDTYYVVGHFHYVLFGGAVFGMFGGLHYWFPKMTGRLLSERLGHVQFWLLFIGFNLTFMPLHLLGLMGMPRRIFTYLPNLGWDIPNLVSALGVPFIVLSVLVFLYNVSVSLRRGALAGNDPWNAVTLEWLASSPPAPYNFAEIPTVRGRRPLYDLKHPDRPDAAPRA